MPVSIPTVLAARFVQRTNVNERLNVIKKSYKFQMISLPIITVIGKAPQFISNYIPKLQFFI